MKSTEFCFWLQGFFELQKADRSQIVISEAQAEVIQNHLNLVFKHEIDPSHGTKEHQEELQKIHDDDQRKDDGETLMRC